VRPGGRDPAGQSRAVVRSVPDTGDTPRQMSRRRPRPPTDRRPGMPSIEGRCTGVRAGYGRIARTAAVQRVASVGADVVADPEVIERDRPVGHQAGFGQPGKRDAVVTQRQIPAGVVRVAQGMGARRRIQVRNVSRRSEIGERQSPFQGMGDRNERDVGIPDDGSEIVENLLEHLGLLHSRARTRYAACTGVTGVICKSLKHLGRAGLRGLRPGVGYSLRRLVTPGAAVCRPACREATCGDARSCTDSW
jgi:hypothetical protein